MRADAHYVDQLVAPAARRVLDDEPRPVTTAAKPAAANKSPSDVSMLNEDALATSLDAVLSCTDLLGDAMPKLTRAVAVDMIRAETQRVLAALRTSQLLKQGVPAERRPLDPRTVVDDVVATVGAEARLRGCRIATTIDVPDTLKSRGDHATLVAALSSVALMLTAGLQELHGARLEVKVSGSGNRLVFSLAQEYVIVPDAFLKIANSANEPGTAQTAPLVALRQIAEAYGGTASAARLPHGTQVSVELPIADVL